MFFRTISHGQYVYCIMDLIPKIIQILLIVMNKWFMTQDFEHVDTLFTNDLSFSDFSIHWWFLPKSVVIMVAVRW